jgi:hypothetical protein
VRRLKVLAQTEQRRIILASERRAHAQVSELIAARLDVEGSALFREALELRHDAWVRSDLGR